DLGRYGFGGLVDDQCLRKSAESSDRSILQHLQAGSPGPGALPGISAGRDTGPAATIPGNPGPACAAAGLPTRTRTESQGSVARWNPKSKDPAGKVNF